MNEEKHLINFLKTLASKFDKLIAKYNHYNTYDKGQQDIVTDLDYKIEELCINLIKEKYPNTKIISEEYNPNEKICDSCFIIDPIDGTKNFSCHLPMWAFQIAYMKKGKPIASLIYNRKLKTLITATKSFGTLVNNKKIETHSDDINHSTWIIEGDKQKWKIAEILAKKVLAVRSYGTSAMAFSLAITSNANIIIHKRCKPWDIIPGYFACQQSKLICKKLPDGTTIITHSRKQLNFALEILNKLN